jgi:hypothetical protein
VILNFFFYTPSHLRFPLSPQDKTLKLKANADDFTRARAWKIRYAAVRKTTPSYHGSKAWYFFGKTGMYNA